jgi:serine/threonine-protein kinase
MAEWNAEDLSQRIRDLGLVEQRELDIAWSELGTRDVSHEEFADRLLNKQLITNFQLDKVLKGDRVGFFYGKYRVLYMVGAGTFARVFRAVHTRNERVVALKVLRRRYRNEPDQVELFLREARMGERLKHTNIVRVYDVSSDIRAPYMVMEFVEGQTLREFMKMRKKLDAETSLNLMIDVISGLDHARKRGITHRDMKLSNVLVTSTGRAKLVDFGLATISEVKEELMAAAPNARSIDYVALERGTNVPKNDHRSDIYFAGCMFYHMLTGKPPLVETRDRLIRMSVSRFHEVEPITKLEPKLPASVTSVVNRAMCFEPNNRYQEPDQMLVDLKRAKLVLEKGEERAAGLDEAPLPDELKRPVDTEGKGYTVMVIESKMELQDIMRDQLKKRGYRVLITSAPSRAIQRFEDEIQVADCAVFSTQELGAQAVAAFNKLGELEQARDTPAILLVDKRHKELIEVASTNEHRILLPMPLKMKQLRLALRKLLRTANETDE